MPLKTDRRKLEDWISEHFREYKRYRDDYLVCTPFDDKPDRKFKLSISPERACFHCWKTNESGPLWLLVSKLDRCSKHDAIEMVYEVDNLERFDDKISELKGRLANQEKTQQLAKLKLPEGFTRIDFASSDPINVAFLNYCVRKRGLDPTKWRLGYCAEGKYRGRLVIPFYGKEHELIYWIARAMGDEVPKYHNPAREDGASKSDVLFSSDWRFAGRSVLITEGAFDSMSLIEAGLTAGAILGKDISEAQVMMLREAREVVMATDADDDGKKAVAKNIKILSDYGIKNVRYVQPGLGCKDWNEMLVKIGNLELRKYVDSNIRQWDLRSEVAMKLRLRK